MSVKVIKQHQLPATDIARELVGADHGAGVCLIFVHAPPGTGPRLHKHAYEEVFITLEGEATFVAGGERIVAGAGDVVIVLADTPHAFTNTGDGPLRQIDIYVSPTFRTEWL